MAASHVTLDTKPFDPAFISKETHEFNEKLMDIMSKGPKWFEVGAEKYRQMREAGETPLPKATLLENAIVSSIPSRDTNRQISTRIIKPTNQAPNTPIKGVYMHIHGGGWVLQTEYTQDPMLQSIANGSNVLVISIGYRLAPEHKFPSGPQDCYDAAEYLVQNSTHDFGAPLSFLGGESAGGHLSMLTMLHLAQHPDPKFSSFNFKGIVLNFGAFDLTGPPSWDLFQKPVCLVLDRAIMEKYADAFIPDMTIEDKRHPSISPLFADLQALRGRLPPALFTCGTEDPLLDDTVFMNAKYQMAGAEAIVKIMPGAPHGYIMFSRDIKGSLADEGLRSVEEFLNGKL